MEGVGVIRTSTSGVKGQKNIFSENVENTIKHGLGWVLRVDVDSRGVG